LAIVAAGRVPSGDRRNSISGAPHIVSTDSSSRGEYIDRVVKIKRCAAVVKGGRRFSFAAMVVMGDGRGRVGWGYGKANEVPNAVEKAQKQRPAEMIELPLVNSTIPHRVMGRFGAAHVVLIPAGAGTGIIAGAAVRAVCEAAGISNILTKSHGSNNPVTLVKAPWTPWSRMRTLQRGGATARSVIEVNIDEVNRGIQRNKRRRRIGRGPGSGWGKTAGQGTQAKVPRRLVPEIHVSGRHDAAGPPDPKRGFHNEFAAVVVSNQLERSRTCLRSRRRCHARNAPRQKAGPGRWDLLKVLGNGELTKKLRVSAHRFSATAREKIEKAGGEVIVLRRRPRSQKKRNN